MLDHRGVRETIRLRIAGAFQRRLALAIVTFDHQRAGLVDEVEVTDRRGPFGQLELKALTRPVACLGVKGHDTQEITFVLAARGQQRFLEHGPQQTRFRLQRHALVPARAWHGPIRPLHRCGRDTGRVRPFQLHTIHHRRIDALDPPVQCGLDQIGAELLADPDAVADALDALQIEIRAGQIAAVCPAIGNAEGHFEIGIMQKNRFLDLDLACVEISVHPAEEQQRIGAVRLRAKAVVRQHIDRPVLGTVHRETGKPLQRLANEGQVQPRQPFAMQPARVAWHRHRHAIARATSEFTTDPRILRRIRGRRDKAQRRQVGMARKRGIKRLLRDSRDGQKGQGKGKNRVFHKGS